MVSQIEIVKTARLDAETPWAYAERLEGMGATETACRKALARQFGVAGAEADDITSTFENMRLRDIDGDMRRHPNRSEASRVHWIARNFHVTEAEAARLARRAAETRTPGETAR